MLHWIVQHQTEIGAFSNLALACLTLVLIVITAIYVRANWNVMRLIETDLRIKTQPIPRLEHEIKRIDQGYEIYFTLTTSNAPLVLQKVTVTATVGETFGPQGTAERYSGTKILHVGQPFTFSAKSNQSEPIIATDVEIEYSDQSGMFCFTTLFRNFRGEKLYNRDGQPYGSFLPVDDVHTTITRKNAPFNYITPPKPLGPIGRLLKKVEDFFYLPSD